MDSIATHELSISNHGSDVNLIYCEYSGLHRLPSAQIYEYAHFSTTHCKQSPTKRQAALNEIIWQYLCPCSGTYKFHLMQTSPRELSRSIKNTFKCVFQLCKILLSVCNVATSKSSCHRVCSSITRWFVINLRNHTIWHRLCETPLLLRHG